ncbi:MAG: hypothetical protein O7B25_13320 [Gammaproteobacteria bacterium]|nr:hypothetical protein [Gammaproteobacteria bacterium]
MFLALALPGSVAGAESGAQMWGCAPVGERRNILYLTDRGPRSYIKFSGQRIPATLTSDADETRWTWGSNSVALDTDNFVHYFEGDTVKARFKCKKL